MAVDYGAWYTEGSRMQRAADAAALAGVVWLPDLATATTVAQTTAKSDGYDNALSNITVAVSKLSDYELKVVITDTAGKVFLSSFVKKNVTISRTSTAKYILPIPLGSPKNFFGTGPFNTADPENFYAAINSRCESKLQGDPFAVPYITSSATNACNDNGKSTNGDFIDPTPSTHDGDQYEYYITVPANRTQDIYVDIWNPAGDESHQTTTSVQVPHTTTVQVPSTVQNSNTITSTGTRPTMSCAKSGNTYTCTITATYSAKSTAKPSSTATCPNTGGVDLCKAPYKNGATTYFTVSDDYTSGSPSLVCDNGTGSGTKTYGCTYTMSAVQSATDGTPTFTCTLTSGTYSCDIDSSTTTYTPQTTTTYTTQTTTSTSNVTDPGTSQSDVAPTTTFTLYSADSTPLDDSDNPILSAANCGTSAYPNPKTVADGFNASTRTIMGQDGWYDMCVIPASAPSGQYILGVKNIATGSEYGINAYGIMASYANNIGATCDSRSDLTCPKVAGKNWISIYANATASVASFYLAEIDAQYAGKTLLITLFDPGEGGKNIQILDPNGTPTAFVATDEGVDDKTPATSLASSTTLDVSNGTYNGHYVQLSIPLPANYGTSYSQFWWKIQYTFNSGSVTDRTTWGVQVLGNPVHLTS
jgi:hypothetical protein